MELNQNEISILKQFGGDDKLIKLVNETSRREKWTYDILSHWASYVVENSGIMNDALEDWANGIASALQKSEERETDAMS